MAADKPRQIFAFSGVLGDDDARVRNFELTEHALSLVAIGGRPVRVCYIPTAIGDLSSRGAAS